MTWEAVYAVPRHVKTQVEQAIARGASDEAAAAELSIDLATVSRVHAAMEEAVRPGGRYITDSILRARQQASDRAANDRAREARRAKAAAR